MLSIEREEEKCRRIIAESGFSHTYSISTCSKNVGVKWKLATQQLFLFTLILIYFWTINNDMTWNYG